MPKNSDDLSDEKAIVAAFNKALGFEQPDGSKAVLFPPDGEIPLGDGSKSNLIVDHSVEMTVISKQDITPEMAAHLSEIESRKNATALQIAELQARSAEKIADTTALAPVREQSKSTYFTTTVLVVGAVAFSVLHQWYLVALCVGGIGAPTVVNSLKEKITGKKGGG